MWSLLLIYTVLVWSQCLQNLSTDWSFSFSPHFSYANHSYLWRRVSHNRLIKCWPPGFFHSFLKDCSCSPRGTKHWRRCVPFFFTNCIPFFHIKYKHSSHSAGGVVKHSVLLLQFTDFTLSHSNVWPKLFTVSSSGCLVCVNSASLSCFFVCIFYDKNLTRILCIFTHLLMQN